MQRLASSLVVCCLMVVLRPGLAVAQVAFPGFDQQWSNFAEKVDDNHFRSVGQVELLKGDTRFYADKADYYVDTHRLVASGNVTVVQGETTISAASIDFNTETELGTFYGSPAWGMVSLGNRVDRSMFGTLEPDMMFYGDTIQKIGKKKYRLTHGGFTTCVQPVPRWELTSGSIVISLEHYAILTNPVMRVKGVPVFYLPILYYPVKTKEDRSTGFLMPTYGTSTAQGFRLSNAFFWAIGRSQDLTVMHDWFTKTGQGVGTDYRYVLAPGSGGDLQTYILNQNEIVTPNTDGTTTTNPGKRSYKIKGSANETINPHMRVGGTIYYFTDLVTQQTYNTNIYDASRSTRTMNANFTGSWGGYRIAAGADRTEFFSGTTSSTLTGSLPRLSFSRAEQPIGNLPIYVTLGGEAVTLQRGTTTTSTGDTPTTTITNLSVSRIDFSPTVRIPFTRLPFLTVNSSISWRGTYWTKSYDGPDTKNIIDQPISRRLFDFETAITGPVVSRIFNTPDSGYADKLKHTIEPFVNLGYTTAVPEFDRIVQWESVDGIVGGTTQVTYGVTNHLYAKRKRDGKVTASREILNVGVRQTYYTNDRASQFDPNYSNSFSGTKPYHLSPIALTARAAPADQISATFRAEIDSQYKTLRSVSANGNYSIGNWLGTSAGWTLTRTIGPTGLVDPSGVRHFLNGTTNVRLAQNKYGGNYTFNFDVVKGQFVQQRITGYYNAQCCGFAVDYQAYNFGTLAGVLVPQDHRFNFSFTLAGLGSFSNFFGALGGAPH